MKISKLDLRKEKEVMDKISRLNARGEMNFSNYDGDDMYDGDDFEDYEDFEQLGALDSYDGYAPKGRGRSGVLKAPQRTISINIQNNVGITTFTAKTAGTVPSIVVTLFGATVNGLPGVAGLGTVKSNPTLGVMIDGILYPGTASATDQDLTVTSDTSSYKQIFAESQASPYEVYGNKIFCTAQSQLIQTYQTIENDVLGRQLTVPYTPFDKQSAFQFSSTIIEDSEFRLKLDGNMSLQYTLFSPNTSGVPAGTSNAVKFSFYLYKIVEANRILNGKAPVVTSKTKRMPSSTQSFRLLK